MSPTAGGNTTRSGKLPKGFLNYQAQDSPEAPMFDTGAGPSQPPDASIRFTEVKDLPIARPDQTNRMKRERPPSPVSPPSAADTSAELQRLISEQLTAMNKAFAQALADQEMRLNRRLEEMSSLADDRKLALQQPPSCQNRVVLPVPPLPTPPSDRGSACGSAPDLVPAQPIGLNQETHPQLAAVVQDMQRQMQCLQSQLERVTIAMSRQPRVALSRDKVPRGTRDRRSFAAPDPLRRLTDLQSKRDYTTRTDGEASDDSKFPPTRTMRAKHRHHGSCRRHPRGSSTDGSSESEFQSDDEDHGRHGHVWDSISQRTLPSHKGPRMKGMKELQPSNPLFKNALSYRGYRLKNNSQDTNYDFVTEPGKAAAILRPVLKRHTFDGDNPVSILRFLQVFKRQCDDHKFSEGEAFLALPYILTDHANDAFSASCEFGDTSSGGISNYCQAVEFLLRLFAKDRYLDDATDKLDAVKQCPDEEEIAYAHCLHDAAHDFGPVFVERDLVTRFVKGLTDTLKPMLRAQHFRPQPTKGLYDVVERAASVGDSFRAISEHEERKSLNRRRLQSAPRSISWIPQAFLRRRKARALSARPIKLTCLRRFLPRRPSSSLLTRACPQTADRTPSSPSTKTLY